MLVCLLMMPLISHAAMADREIAGTWDCVLESPGGDLRFGLELQAVEQDQFAGYLINGTERIVVPTVQASDRNLTLEITHYDSVIEARYDNDAMSGAWRKRIGKDQWTEMNFRASRRKAKPHGLDWSDGEAFQGRWSVKFSRNEFPAVAVFALNGDRSVSGTFQTTSGDYRYLHGGVLDGKLELSCFDGSHAFLFHARSPEEGKLTGDFWSSDNWHETWTAIRDPEASMPDAFNQTRIVDGSRMGDRRFPDLNGTKTRLNDPKFGAKARIIYVFGSWCPNCHDAAAYFSELQRKYGDDLSILGLAFEVTGDFDRDVVQVKRYLERHHVDYPVLIAGLSDKKLASESLPFLDQVRSYPTTIFLDSRNNVVSVHTGFAGPATGKAHQELRASFEKLIDTIVADAG